MTKLLLSVWLLLLAGCSYHPPEPDQNAAFRRANAQLLKGNYVAALGLYQQLEKQGVNQPALFCNLGNACRKAGRVGWAVYYYEKALALAPLDSQLIANRRAVQTPANPTGPTTAPGAPGLLKAADIGAAAAAFGLLLGGICYFVGAVVKGGTRKKKALTPCRFLLLASALLLLFTGGIMMPLQKHEAIIVQSKTIARSGPSDAANRVFKVAEGEKVEIQNHYRQWLKIQTVRGEQGWVAAPSAAHLEE